MRPIAEMVYWKSNSIFTVRMCRQKGGINRKQYVNCAPIASGFGLVFICALRMHCVYFICRVNLRSGIFILVIVDFICVSPMQARFVCRLLRFHYIGHRESGVRALSPPNCCPSIFHRNAHNNRQSAAEQQQQINKSVYNNNWQQHKMEWNGKKVVN